MSRVRSPLFAGLLIGLIPNLAAAQGSQVPPPAPRVSSGAVVYNPWYPGNVVPFFSVYPFAGVPYLLYEHPVPPPIPVPPPAPQNAPPPPQATTPVAPSDQPYATLGYVPSAPCSCAPSSCTH